MESVATQAHTVTNVHALLNQSAARFGDNTAVVHRSSSFYVKWSYAQLKIDAERMADYLQRRGLKKGDRVLIWGPNSPQWVITLFGCFAAGLVAVPLDVRSGPEFVERVIAKSRPSYAVVGREMEAAHSIEIPKTCLEDIESNFDRCKTPTGVDVRADDLAELVFTSGTTGDPKGVMLTHGNLLANLASIGQIIRGKPSYRVLSILPLSHMFEQTASLFMAIRCGASVTFTSSLQPTILFRMMQDRKVTTLLLVPQALDLFMKGIETEVRRQGKTRTWATMMRVASVLPRRLRRLLFRSVHARFGGSLDFIVAGGAPLEPDLGRKWSRMGVKVLQAYGATEASPAISIHSLEDPRFDSVGRPVPGTQVQIAEDGEVLVRGANIMQGYWEAPEETKAALENGWYKTGDMGYFDDEGYLHLKGRKKEMVVLANGMNVYPVDIESVLLKHPNVRDAAVVGMQHRGSPRIHAFLLLDDPEAGQGVIDWANHQLSDHQHVRSFTVWHEDDFPRTHTRKVKKQDLVASMSTPVAPARAREEAPREAQAEAPSVEALVAEVAGVEAAGVASDHSLEGDLGIDSLKRVELLAALEARLGVALDERHVHPDLTVRELRRLAGAGSSQSPQRLPTWGMSWWCCRFRGVLQRAVIFPLIRGAYRVEVNGHRSLASARGPVVYAANHSHQFDSGIILKAFPSPVRRHLAIAAAGELWSSRFWGTVNPLLGNAFPFSRAGSKANLDYLGGLLNSGWSVLMYPEGKVTVGGPIQPFKQGIGMIAQQARVPVVPVRLRIQTMGFPWQVPILRRGAIEVVFGEPMTFSAASSQTEIAQAVSAAVHAL